MAGVTTIARERAERAGRRSVAPVVIDTLVLAALILALIMVWRMTAASVRVTVDGFSDGVRSHSATVGGLLVLVVISSSLNAALTRLERSVFRWRNIESG